MNIATIEDLAYLMKQAKEEKAPKPIVFLGAGASKTGGVPLAGQIVEDILQKYSANPKIKNIREEDKTYAELMARLTPFERNKLLKSYIDNAKINVSHIYLAQLMVNNYVDYVLTVNFDNLMLRALALYNEFPPTYDMAILKDLTTTNFKEKSVVYLHGQHHGLWLLNTKEEMAKVNMLIPPILHSIRNNRVWIFIGYSGDDPIFDHIKNLVTRFDNGLYWVTYNDNNPTEKVCEGLLNRDNSNTYLIQGYDADSFMLKLNAQLELGQPSIIDTPFTALQQTLENIVDIDDKDHYRVVKERLVISNRYVSAAIQQYEKGEPILNMHLKEEIDSNLLKKQIIDHIINDNFNEEKVTELENKARRLDDREINDLMSTLFNLEGLATFKLAREKKEDILFLQTFTKYQKATEFNQNNARPFDNWGLAIAEWAQLKNDEELYKQSFVKYKKASDLSNNDDITFNNWGCAIWRLAKLRNDESLYLQSIEKYQNAIILNPKNNFAFTNWGIAIFELAELKKNDDLYLESIAKYQKAIELNPREPNPYFNLGNSILSLARLKNDEVLYEQCLEKYQMATELNLKNCDVYNNWGNAIAQLAKLKKSYSLYMKSIEKFKKAIELEPTNWNTYYNWGNALMEIAKITNDENFNSQSFEKYNKATKLNPKESKSYANWGTSIVALAKLKDSEDLWQDAFDKLQRANELGAGVYNLACWYALRGHKSESLSMLESSFVKKEIKINHVQNDDDFISLREDPDFIALLEKYK